MDIHAIRKDLLRRLPPLVPRTKVEALTGGLINAKTLANKDSLGFGPKQRLKFRGKVCYPREALVDWIISQLEV